VTLGKNTSDGGTGLFPAIFVITGNENDVLAFADTGIPLIDKRIGERSGDHYHGRKEVQGKRKKLIHVYIYFIKGGP
jgi:hypothetical protein